MKERYLFVASSKDDFANSFVPLAQRRTQVTAP